MSSDFADLARDRDLLQKFCQSHPESLNAFRADPSFKLHLDEEPLPELRHLTSTGTCIESLLDCPPEPNETVNNLANNFAVLAIRREADKWKSEGSAAIYCRCRALPLVVKYLSDRELISARATLQNHIETILKQLEEPDRFAIGEADPDPQRRGDWYPPNAYHTFWFLNILEGLQQRFNSTSPEPNRFLTGRRAKEMQLWAKSVAGRQIALHSANSPSLDSDQLAWSLAILIRFGPDFQSSLTDQDFLREGLKALFSKQTPAGIWPHGQRLFHYQYSGNAYCYIYETFTALLKAVLDRQNEGAFLRSAIAPYHSNLMKLWKYARDTQIPLNLEPSKSAIEKIIGWSSGHRVEDRRPESWATASVFSFAQSLRRLLGIWTREEALSGLRQVRAFASSAEALEEIAKRGDTWSLPASAPTVAEDLMTLFVNPTRLISDKHYLEPDNQPIKENQARSAILFGPPGTSKTRLARAIAGAIGWHYVELHASHFVSEGLPEVQRTADNLFQRLMELDHSVVLFDEIDELVRERDMEPDAFGRFLTTSMLPKLAELWEQRKVMYFIATNHIEYFDRAVTRARRFDALIFVTPPSFDSKVGRLKSILSKERPAANITIGVSEGQFMQALYDVVLTNQRTDDDRLPDKQALAKFILLRWDQLEELAVRLLNILDSASVTEIDITEDILTRALVEISDPSLLVRKTYLDYLKARKYSMRDYGKQTVWEVEGVSEADRGEPLRVSEGIVWLECIERPEKLSGAYIYEIRRNGRVKATKR